MKLSNAWPSRDEQAAKVTPGQWKRLLLEADFSRRGQVWDNRSRGLGGWKIGRFNRRGPARWVVFANDPDTGFGPPLDLHEFAQRILGIHADDVDAWAERFFESYAARPGDGGDAARASTSPTPVWPEKMAAQERGYKLMGDFGLHVDLGVLKRYRAANQHQQHSHLLEQIAQGVSADGRLHPSWALLDTAGGRGTVEPNILDLPAALKSVIRASPGCLLFEADISGANVVASAGLTGDPWLRSHVERGGDLHRAIGTELLARELTDHERAAIKGFVLRALNGAGRDELYKQLHGFSLTGQHRIVATWKASALRIEPFKAWIESQRAAGTITLPLADWAFPVVDTPGQVAGRLAQGVIAWCIGETIAELNQVLPPLGGGVIAHRHDSILVEGYAHVAEPIQAAIRNVFERPLSWPGWPTMRIPFTLRSGTTWAMDNQTSENQPG
jgi:hypothetical protein